MPLTISDDLLQQAGMSESDALIEIACRLFHAERLSLHQAARWAGLDRIGMEDALASRGLPIYRFTENDLAMEVRDGIRTADAE